MQRALSAAQLRERSPIAAVQYGCRRARARFAVAEYVEVLFGSGCIPRWATGPRSKPLTDYQAAAA